LDYLGRKGYNSVVVMVLEPNFLFKCSVVERETTAKSCNPNSKLVVNDVCIALLRRACMWFSRFLF
jgi:hypothetical protein